MKSCTGKYPKIKKPDERNVMQRGKAMQSRQNTKACIWHVTRSAAWINKKRIKGHHFRQSNKVKKMSAEETLLKTVSCIHHTGKKTARCHYDVYNSAVLSGLVLLGMHFVSIPGFHYPGPCPEQCTTGSITQLSAPFTACPSTTTSPYLHNLH